MNRLIGALFEREANVQTEAVVPTGAFLRGTHDAVAAARDDHKAVLDGLAAHLLGHLEFGGFRREPGGAEDRDFATVGIGLENLGGVTQLFQCPDDELDVGYRGFVPTKQKRCFD